MTILTCANASGTLCFPILVSGKSAKPCPLKNYNFRVLPVVYKDQKSACIDANLFADWFHHKFVPRAENFLKENVLPQKALLLVDNALSHPAAEELKSRGIIVKFLPSNTTSLIQSMDQGIIVSFKRHYKKLILQEILLNCDKKICPFDKLFGKYYNERRCIFDSRCVEKLEHYCISEKRGVRY